MCHVGLPGYLSRRIKGEMDTCPSFARLRIPYQPGATVGFAYLEARRRTDVAQVNELLCKVLCHNLCVLIQNMYELGIEVGF